MRVLELILSADKLPLFGFLKSTPTQVWKKGNTTNLPIMSL